MGLSDFGMLHLYNVLVFDVVDEVFPESELIGSTGAVVMIQPSSS